MIDRVRRKEGDGWVSMRVVAPASLSYRYLGSCEALSVRSGDGVLMAGQMEKDEIMYGYISDQALDIHAMFNSLS